MDNQEPKSVAAPIFKIHSMELVRSHMESSSDFLGINNGDFAVSVEFEGGADPSLKIIAVTVTANIHLNSDIEKSVAGVVVRYFYEISNYEEVVIAKEDGSTQFEMQNINMFNSISASTTRGVMFGLFKGTVFHNAIMPLVDTTKSEISFAKPQ